MNKRQRKRAKRLRERKRFKQESETAENREDLTVQELLGPMQDCDITKTIKPKPISAGWPHPLVISFSVIGILLTCTGLYWAIGQPDIRYIPILEPEAMTTVESKVDGAGNLVEN